MAAENSFYCDSDSGSSFSGFNESDCDFLNISDVSSDDSSDNDSETSETDGPILSREWVKIGDLKSDSYDQSKTGVVEFSETYGPRNIPENVEQPVDYLLMFLGEYLDILVSETNTYGDRKADRMRETGRRFSRFAKWRHTNTAEMRAFIGLILNMGLVKKSCLSDYWSQKLSQLTPFFSKVFTRDRFLLLLSCFHARELVGDLPGREHKVKHFIDFFFEQSRRFYYPRKEVSIDESLVGFQGRAQAIQYMPQKHHHKFGIKIWNICESATGYTLHAKMYPGKNSPVSTNGLGYDVVMQLMQPYFGSGHHLYVDNFFTSIPLAEDLLLQSTYLTGTLRKNRKHVPDIVKVKQKKGELTAARRGHLLVVNWYDKKPVYALSTNDTAKPVTYISRRKRAHEGVPHLITLYNQHMGGVDMSDMRCYMFLDERRTNKWTNKVFFFMLGRIMLNAFIVYTQHTRTSVDQVSKKLGRREFIVEVVEGLVGDFRQERKRVGRPLQTVEDRLVSPRDHLSIIKLPKGKRRDCAVCSNRDAKRVRTSFICGTCDVGLCPGDCWKNYHTKRNLSPVQNPAIED